MTTPDEFPYFVIEHHENDTFDKNGWCSIEYLNILRVATPGRVIITNMTKDNQLKLPDQFRLCAAITDHSILDFINNKNDINNDLTIPLVLREIHKYHNNASPFQSTPRLEASEPSALPSKPKPSQICFLDEQGSTLHPSELGSFQYLIVGGILGTFPSSDRGGHLRNHGFQVRNCGPEQYSTDTCVVACSLALRHGITIDDIEALDSPEVFEDEIDTIPLEEKVKLGLAKRKALKKMRESTSIRMRYLTHQQSKLDGTPYATPRHVVCFDRSGVERPQSHMVAFPCICDCTKCEDDKKVSKNDTCTTNHAGDWYHSRPQTQFNLHNETAVRIPRITPGLLNHIFHSLDDGLVDLDGQLDIDFEAMELGIGEQEDAELCKILFME